MSIDEIAAYGEPFPEDFATWHPADQTKWKQTKAREVLLNSQSSAFADLAKSVAPTLPVPPSSPSVAQRRAMGDMVPDPTSSTTPISPHVRSSLAEYGLEDFQTVGEALAHVRRTAGYLGIPKGHSKRITPEGTLTAEAERARAAEADRSSAGRRIFTGEEARLIDEADTVFKTMRVLMEYGRTPMTSLPTPRDYANDKSPHFRKKETRPTIENESLDVTTAMAEERKTQAQGLPVEDPKKVKKRDKFISSSIESAIKEVPKHVEIKHVEPVPFTTEGFPDEVTARAAHAKAVQEQIAAHAPSRPTRTEPVRATVLSFTGDVRIPDNNSVIRHVSPEEQERAALSRSNVEKRAQKEMAEKPQPINQRVDTGRQLGVQLPSGHVAPIPSHQRDQAIIGGRIMDRTPWSGHPIVEL